MSSLPKGYCQCCFTKPQQQQQEEEERRRRNQRRNNQKRVNDDSSTENYSDNRFLSSPSISSSEVAAASSAIKAASKTFHIAPNLAIIYWNENKNEHTAAVSNNNNNNKLILCQISKQSGSTNNTSTIFQTGDILCFDSSCTRLQKINATTTLSTAISTSNLLQLFQTNSSFPLGCKVFSISKCNDNNNNIYYSNNNNNNTMQTDNENKKDATAHLDHDHLQILQEHSSTNTSSSLSTSTTELPNSTQIPTDSESLLWLVSTHPIPLVSLTLSIKGNNNDNKNNNDASNNTMHDAFRQAHQKRQLVGKIIFHSNIMTTILSVSSSSSTRNDPSMTSDASFTNQKSTAANSSTIITEYNIESLAGIPTGLPTSPSSSSSLSSSMLCYKILPSTRITIVPKQQIPQQQQQQQQQYQQNEEFNSTTTTTAAAASRTLSSPVSNLLLQTLECMNQNIPVPQTFLLSGPPGVGKTFSIQLALQQYPKHLPKVQFQSIRGSELLREPNPALALQQIFVNMMTKTTTMTTTKDDSMTTSSSSSSSRTTNSRPHLLFLDECDALVSVDSVAAMLATMLDQLSFSGLSFSSSGNSNNKGNRNNSSNNNSSNLNHYGNILVVGATNRIDSIPQYLRRAGRFDKELPMAPPNHYERAKILSDMILFSQQQQQQASEPSPSLSLSSSSESESKLLREEEEKQHLKQRIDSIAELCVGYVPADLMALVRRATVLAMQQQQSQQQNSIHTKDSTSTSLSMRTSIIDCLSMAMKDVGASALRDAALAAPPKITWDDIAGDPGGAKTALRQAIEWPRTKAAAFRALQLEPPRGILLHGPPGCAKTTLARAAAGASGIAFVSLSPAQVYASSYVGEAEAVIRRAFTLARSAAPCILFFDEIDSIFGNAENDDTASGGGGGGARGSSAEARVLSTFLNEMDGVDIGNNNNNNSSISSNTDNNHNTNGVLVLGATNRPWTLDAALLRPGRLGDKIIYVPPPDASARRLILENQFADASNQTNPAKTNNSSLNLEYFASDEMTGNFTGAELVGACQEAKMRLLRTILQQQEMELQKQQHQQEQQQKNEEEKTTVEKDNSTENNLDMEFIIKEEYLLEAIQNVKPLLSDPVALEEFRLFGR